MSAGGALVTTSVSEAELAALIAGLASTQPAAESAKAGPMRCAVTDLLADQCAHCRKLPDPTGSSAGSGLGPWFTSTYRGHCSSCGRSFDEFERIRADGVGGWLASCCGQDVELAAQPQLELAAPAIAPTEPPVPLAPPAPAPNLPTGGAPASTIGELRDVLLQFEASRPRTMQKALGPSELGTPCQQQIARKLAGAPRRPVTDPTWAPFQGTAVHASMEKVVTFWNQQLGRERWLAEDRLYIDSGMPDVGIDPIEGNGDAFDTDHNMVVDWKHVGKTALEKLDRGLRMNKPADQQVSPEYRVQAHLYGYGHERKERDVRWVRLVLLARSHDYDESREWTEAYQPEIAIQAIDRYYATHELLRALNVVLQPDLITIVPAAPSRDACKWCPFYRPGQASDWAGCAGDRPPDKHIGLATAGLIAP